MQPRRSIQGAFLGGLVIGLLQSASLGAHAQDKTKAGAPATTTPATTTPATRASTSRTTTALADVHTDFDPKRDGLDFPNVGSFVSPEGDCVGFSAVAIANAQTRTAGGTPALSGLPAEAEAIAIQAAYAKKLHDGTYFFDEVDPLQLVWKDPTDTSVGRSLHDLLVSSGPQILEIQATAFGPHLAHAIVIFGYEKGHFLVSDSNAPDETHTLAFSLESGFGALEPYGQITKAKLLVDTAEFVTLATKLQMPCSKLDGTCAADVYKVEAERLPSDTAIVFSGTVTGGIATRTLMGVPTDAPAYVVANVDGRRLAEVHVAADGSFQLKLPASTQGTLRFWSFTNGLNGVSQIAGYSTSTYELSGATTPTSSIGLDGAVKGTEH